MKWLYQNLKKPMTAKEITSLMQLDKNSVIYGLSNPQLRRYLKNFEHTGVCKTETKKSEYANSNPAVHYSFNNYFLSEGIDK